MGAIAGYLPTTSESENERRRRVKVENTQTIADQLPIIAAGEAAAGRQINLDAARRELAQVRFRLDRLALDAEPEPEPTWVTEALARRAEQEAILVATSDQAMQERARVHIATIDAKLADHERGGRTQAVPPPDPQIELVGRLRAKERSLLALISDLEQQERDAVAAWRREQDRLLASEHEANLRAQFEREEAADREARFAEFKQRNQQ